MHSAAVACAIAISINDARARLAGPKVQDTEDGLLSKLVRQLS